VSEVIDYHTQSCTWFFMFSYMHKMLLN